MEGNGYLGMWSDLAPQDETDWMHWITREHAAERVGIDGFLACRIFRALGTVANRYFILYELKEPEIVGSPQYLARLNAPTPWSQKTMPRLQNFVRGGGRVVASAGVGQAGVLAVLRLDGKPDWDPAALTTELAGFDKVTAARVLLTDQAKTSIKTNEKGLRKNDESYPGLLLIEGLDESAVRNALNHLRSTQKFEASAIDSLPLYRLFFSLPKRLLPA